MHPFRKNSTISKSRSHQDYAPEITVGSTAEKILHVQNRLERISVRSKVLDIGVESLRRLLGGQADRDVSKAMGQLEELRKVRQVIISAREDTKAELRECLGRKASSKIGQQVEDNEASLTKNT